MPTRTRPAEGRWGRRARRPGGVVDRRRCGRSRGDARLTPDPLRRRRDSHLQPHPRSDPVEQAPSTGAPTATSSSRTPSYPRTCGRPTSTGWRRPSVTTATRWCAPTAGWTTPNGSHRTATSVSQADDWVHDWAWWANYLKAKGLELGVYYNPLWATRSAVTNPSVTVVGRPDVKVADIVNPGDYFDGGGWLAVGGHHPRRGRGVREGLRRVLPRTRCGVPPDRLSGLVRGGVRPERGHGGSGPRPRLLSSGARVDARGGGGHAAEPRDAQPVRPRIRRTSIRRPGPDRQRRQLRHLVRLE